MSFSLLYKPLNIIRGNNKAGDIALAFWASLNSDPVIKPILFPTNPKTHKVSAIKILNNNY